MTKQLHIGLAIAALTICSSTMQAATIGHWKLNDNVGSTTAADETGSFPGTLLPVGNEGTFGIAGAPEGTALDVTTSPFDQSVRVSQAAIDPSVTSGEITLAGWINPDAVNAGFQLIATQWNDTAGAGNKYLFHFNNRNVGGSGSLDELELYYSLDGTNFVGPVTATDVVPAGTWTHVAFTMKANSGAIQLYAGGVPVGTPGTYTAASFPNLSQSLFFGNKVNTTALNFDGQFDDFQLYDEVLTPAQILFLKDNPGVAIPEPSSFILTLLGLLGLLGYARRPRN